VTLDWPVYDPRCYQCRRDAGKEPCGVAENAMCSKHLSAAYTAALTALEASDSDRQKLAARVAELEDRQRAIFDAGFKQARLMGDNAHHYCGDRADALFVGAMVRLEAELAKEQRDG
jgi:hypothetical protein